MSVTFSALVECDECGLCVDVNPNETAGLDPSCDVDDSTPGLEGWSIDSSSQLCPECWDGEES